MLYFKEKIPNDWQIEAIANLIKNYQQGFASGARDDNGILQLRMNNITTEGRVLLDKYLKVPIPDNIDNYLLKKDDVIFNNTNSVKLIGKTAIFNDECDYCTFSNHLTRLRADKSKVSPHWLLYHFNQAWRKNYFRRICNVHVNQAGIKREDIENFKITLPKLSEQYKIISVLNNIQDLIGKIKILIEKLQILKKGLMQRLFTEGIEHTEFKETRLGRIPKSWNVLQLKKIGRIFTGKTPSTKIDDYWGDDIPFITPADISDNHYIRKTERFVSYIGAKQSKPIPKNSICTVCIGSTVGKVALTVENSIANQQINSLICDENIDPHYICYAISKRSSYLKTYAGVAAVPIVKKSLFESFRIPVPSSIEEQKLVSKILLSVDNNIEIEVKFKKKLKEIKKGLMQELITGKKRVKIN